MSHESELARTFDDVVVDRHARHFVQLLLDTVPDVSGPVRVLDLACGTGYGTLPLLEALPEGSSIVALSDDRFSLKQLHTRLDAGLRRTLFPRKENLERLPFADQTVQDRRRKLRVL